MNDLDIMKTIFRNAHRDELTEIVDLLAEDELGARREHVAGPLPEAYMQAFDAIETDPNNEIIVGALGSTVIAVLQLTFLPNLTYRGRWRAQIEGVRVAANHRSGGVGRQLIDHAIGRARARRCLLVQLTTDKTRSDALRFYETLGFRASHEGMKLMLE